MTPKQMYRAMRKWGISIVLGHDGNWHAGHYEYSDFQKRQFTISDASPIKGKHHTAKNPEEAVEDYCNARDLEWDV